MSDCPTPDKLVFRSAAAARRYWQRSNFTGKDRLWPYRCPSGGREHWHLTHQTPDEQAEISARVASQRDRTLLIACPRGCGATVTVIRPAWQPLPTVPDTDQPAPYPTRHERRQYERVGRVVCEALLAHALFDCAAFEAEDPDCGHQQGAYTCNLSANHDGRHEVLEYLEAEDRTVTIAWWPALKAVR